MSVKTSATHRLLLSIWQTLFGKRTGHAFPKIAGLFLVGILSYQQSSGQQLLDNFNRANSNTVGTGVIGSAWTEDENQSSYATISSNTVSIGGNNDDRDYIYQDMTSFYQTTLGSGTGILTWQFNMRQNNGSPSGFDNNEIGVAFVLGCDNTSFTSGSGYAVVLGSSSNNDNIRLARFGGGLDADNNITSFITGSTDYSTEYFAIRVTYNPTGNLWSLYVATSGSSFPDPASATYTQIGSTTANNTYTGNNLRYLGCLFNHGGNSDRGTFDNVYIPNPIPNITTQPSALTRCTGTSATFTAAASYDTGIQWEKLIAAVWTPIGGATSNSYTINPVALVDAGDYRVVYTNSAGTATSNVVTLTVNDAAVGGTVTSSATVCSGSNSGTLNLSGETGSITRWESSTNGGGSWSPIVNTTNSYTYTNVATTTQYRAFITNGGTCTATSIVATITTVQPTLYSVTGGGAYCTGGTGVVVGLSDSETGHDYELYLGGAPLGSPVVVAGTGNAISFGLQTDAGNYTVVATNTTLGCTRTMTGSVNITINPEPIGGTIGGPAVVPVCLGSNSGTLTLSGQVGTIAWQSSTNGGGLWTNTGNSTTSQTYTNLSLTTQYRAVLTNTGCASATSNVITIVAAQASLFNVTGGGSACAGGAGVLVELDGSEIDVDYQLKNGVSNVGSPISGTGNPLSFGLQTAAGTYTVVASIPSIGSCTRTMTGSAVITIVALPTVTASSSNPVICGPGSTSLSSSGSSNSQTSVTFNNSTPAAGTSIPNISATGVTSTITVSGAPATMAQVTSFSVRISANHTNDGEFEAYLVRPGGTALSTSSNGNYANTITAGSSVCLVADVGTNGDNFVNTVFSDAALQTCDQVNVAPFTGTYKPEDLFATLTGNPNGVWTLKMLDDGGFGSSGTFQNWSITIGTEDGLTYTWTSTPSGFSSSLEDPGTVSPIVNTDYHVTYTNAVTGCTATSTTSVLVGPALTASCSVVTNASCFGSADGEIDVTAVGGTAPLTGTGLQSGLTNGTYTYTVTDDIGCTSTCSSTITVADNVDPVFSGCLSSFSINNDPGMCGQYVSWTDPTASDNCSVSSFTQTHTSGSIFPIGTTTVTYTAVDPSGNQAVCSFDVTVVDADAPSITCPANITVNNASGTCGQVVTFSASALDNCSATISYSPASGSVFPVGTTTVTATATDPAGNAASCNFTVTVVDNELPVFTGCPGTMVEYTNGSCDKIVTWTPPVATDNCAGLTVTSDYNPGDLFQMGITSVTYTATDAAGNIEYCSFDIFLLDNENPVITCPANISVPASASGCSAVVTYSASVTDNCSANITYSPASGSTFPEGTTTVTATATDASNNVSTCQFTVTVVNDLTASSSATSILCNGGSATVTVSATGGTAPYTGDGSFTALAGTHTYTVTDANGCSSSTTITITEPAALVASSSATAILCNGGSATVTVSASGGTAPYTGEGTFTVTAGTYTYTVTDANGCSNTTSITVTEPAAIGASSSAAAILCNGGSAIVTVTATGGTTPYTGTGSFSEVAGTYTYTVTDAGGCSATTSVTLTEPSALLTSSSATTIICNGGSATVTVSATGGTAPYTGDGSFTALAGTHTYTVTDANGCTSSTTITITEPTAVVASASSTSILCNGGSATVTVSATGGTAPYTGEGSFTEVAGTYTYTVTDANGCTGSTTITVTEPATLVASSSATSILCNGGSATVTVSATGGTAPYTGAGSFTEVAGTYTYTVTDANGCTSSTSITLTEPTALVASSTAGTILCNGGTTSVVVSATGGTAPYTGEGSFTVSAGPYAFTVTDANGCTSTTTGTVTEPTAVVASSSATAILCNGGSATVTVSATGGTAPYTGEGSFTVVAGTYSYTITDANGCTGSTTITVTEPTTLVASSSATAILCNGGSATVTVSATGGTAPYTGTGFIH
ncbi:MAG: HYR domain-containing protein [Bacteroidetes bacterium]|nr:HYR domain-containing protein [Bacteroidota bacterium]